jgi:uncharacterized membrane protein
MSASRRDYRINPPAVLIHSERMIHFFELLISTIAYRPYVFIFFACYLFLAITHIGWRRTALFTTVAYAVAFLSEWNSAVAGRGFPFGLYYYIDQTSHRELWIAGVPFMDSLSFTFLSYVSWELATGLLGRLKVGWRSVQVWDQRLAGTDADEPLGCFDYLLAFKRWLQSDLRNVMTSAF